MKKRLHSLRYLLPILIVVIVAGLTAAKQQSSAKKPPYELSNARYVAVTLEAIQKNYLDRERIDPKQMLEGALERVEIKVPEVLAQFEDNRAVMMTVDVASKRFPLRDIDSLGGLKNTLQEVLAFIDQHYSGDVEKADIEYAAVDGMLSTLDPHSQFMNPKAYAEFKVGTRGEFGGLGIVISIKEGNLTVIAPLDGTPASAAGIKAGDRIVQIGDESAINMSLTDAVNKMRGEVGTKIKLVLSRPGRSGLVTMVLTRALINIDSVQSAIMEKDSKRIGYLKVKSFQSNTDDDVSAALESFHKNGKIDGLILDMRNNPGGLLNQAIELADRFVKRGTLLTTVGTGGVVFDRNDAREEGTEPDYPIVVMINEGSASASEIVAGTIRQLGRGVVIGRRSFGKGSVQTIFDLGGGAALKLTIAKYMPAGTLSIQSVGLSPDVDLVPIVIDKKEMNLVEDEAVSEKSLEKHLEESAKIEPAMYSVRYLAPKEDDDDLTRGAKEYSKKPKIENDFAVQFAQDILLHVTGPARKAMLDEIKSTVSAADAAQEAEITKKLAALGIDWNGGKEDGKPQLKVAYELKKGGAPVREVRAGSEAMLELKVTNIGNGPLYKLIGVGRSESPFLESKEFVYGKLLPGETRSWETPIKIPDALPTDDLTLEVAFEDEHKSIPTAIDAIIPVKGREPPRFAFTYTLSQPAGSPLKTMVPIGMNFQIVNTGKGQTSKDTVAQISNESGENVYIESGRATLGAMATGAAKAAPFKFHLTPDFSDDDVKLEFTVFDSMRIDSISQNIKIRRDSAQITPPAGKRYEPPTIEIAAHPISTAAETIDIKGTIRDNESVHDYFVFVGDKKITYVPNPSQTKEVPFSVTLPLKPGENLVVVAARDEDRLMGRTLIAVQRTSGKKEKKAGAEPIPTLPGAED